ncbi:hypothetical protein DYD21_06980 [Rhodohalobacter sp. SW132]|uniref:HlyD family secretion protein n=1 Tax=Rhodohalobacter sp. SW132 TaxID=2293433 RepID=UPI000E254C00|nr:hypothetical protein [Rhodohalobacter sp. SW132]REL38343.1 hypothetical protein DYD21_06980 [Rhodohalobacter sp. SW132]
MRKQQYEPIPIPWKQRLREIRVRFLPLIVFLCVSTAVYFLWEDRVQSPGAIGEVVADTRTVSSPARGRLAGFSFLEFDEVREGDFLGEIITTDPIRAEAQIEVLRSEVEYIRQSLEPVIDEERNRLNVQDLRVDMMQQRIQLAEAQLQYRQSAADFNRIEQLYERGLSSEQEYELALLQMETDETRVEQTELLIEDIAESLQEIREFGEYSTQTDRNPMAASIEMQNRRIESLERELEPRRIYAPGNGVVSLIYHRSGEYVDAGVPILKIEEKEPAYIVGYIRQPFTVEPEVGMEVEIRTRKPGRDFVRSHITRLGGHMRLIEQHLQRPGAIYESGLPVQIALDQNLEELTFTPGEIVDIVLMAN